MCPAWEKDAANMDHVMLWAACCTCFSLVGGDNYPLSMTPELIYPMGMLRWTATQPPTVEQVIIKASKQTPSGEEWKVYLGRTDNKLCPVSAVVAHLAIHHKLGIGPFFRFQFGIALTRASFVNRVRQALKESGVDTDKFSGHSFHIRGTSTTSSKRGQKLANKNVGQVGKLSIRLACSSPKRMTCWTWPVSGTS